MNIRFGAAVCLFMLCLATAGVAGEGKPILIGISQIVEHPALDSCRRGFMDDLAEHGYAEGKRVVYSYKNAQNNRVVSGQIARTLVGDKPDLVFAISTPSAQDVAAATKSIPILFCAVTDPTAAGLVKSLSFPGGNVSGTADRSPVGEQLDLILEIVPRVKRIGIIFNSGETNSVASVKEIEAEAGKRGIVLFTAPATSSSAVKMAAESLVGKVDAIHIPTDNTVVLALESVVKVCQDNRIPLFASDVDSVTRGAIAALAVDYHRLGRQTGAMARRILEGKARISEMPVESQKELLLYLNLAQAAKMGVSVPESVKRRATKTLE